MNKSLVRIGNRLINLSNVTYIIDRTVHFNDGTTWTTLEPEIQELLAAMFETPRPVPVETVTIVEEPLVRKKKVLKKQ
jgi:hypothetical protein